MAVAWVDQWNNLALLASAHTYNMDIAWPVLEKSAHSLNRLTRHMEAVLEQSEYHSTQIWFAWGLLDVHAKNLQALIECENTEQFKPVLVLIEDDFRHLLTCLQRQPLEPDMNRRLVQWTFGRGRAAIVEGFNAVHTILESQVKRVKRRRLLAF
jgi:hypothetical protein